MLNNIVKELETMETNLKEKFIQKAKLIIKDCFIEKETSGVYLMNDTIDKICEMENIELFHTDFDEHYSIYSDFQDSKYIKEKIGYLEMFNKVVETIFEDTEENLDELETKLYNEFIYKLIDFLNKCSTISLYFPLNLLNKDLNQISNFITKTKFVTDFDEKLKVYNKIKFETLLKESDSLQEDNFICDDDPFGDYEHSDDIWIAEKIEKNKVKGEKNND